MTGSWIPSILWSTLSYMVANNVFKIEYVQTKGLGDIMPKPWRGLTHRRFTPTTL